MDEKTIKLTDDDGREWDLRLDDDTIDRVRRESGVDLRRLDRDFWGRVDGAEPDLMRPLLRAILGPQAATRGLGWRETLSAVDDVTRAAAAALVEWLLGRVDDRATWEDDLRRRREIRQRERESAEYADRMLALRRGR